MQYSADRNVTLSSETPRTDLKGILVMMTSFFNATQELNPQQKVAVEHFDGPLLVIAGAGTGKTKTLAARVASLIQGGADPGRILLLTFTRRAASEMIRRAGKIVGESVSAAVWGGTFHATANRLLRIYCQPLGLDNNFVILDKSDAEDLLDLVRTDLHLHKSTNRFPRKGTLLSMYSRCINTGESLDKVLGVRFPKYQKHMAEIRELFEGYDKRKAEGGLLDYDDLLVYWEHALDKPGIGEALAANFQHVLVDEYQDTNPLQASVLRKQWAWMAKVMAPKNGQSATAATSCSIMVVGDDAQSIYSFRGATIENILHFPNQFQAPTFITLEQNYRSVKPILDAANGVMRRAQKRFTKNLWSERASEQKPILVTCADEREQCRYVVERILAHREEGIPLTKQAVLFRASHNSDALEIELARHNIPFVKWGGLKFLEAAHVKDMLAFLRVLENPKDEVSWMRLLQLLDGIGPGRARQVIQHLQATPDGIKGLLSWSVPVGMREQYHSFARVLVELSTEGVELPLPAQIDHIREFYDPILESRYEHAEMRARDLEQLQLLSGQVASRAAFLADLTLDPPNSTGDLSADPLLDDEYLVLSTIHSAKGCEWSVVYVIHAADGIIPSDMANGEADIEEERRLLYVAMTRARDRLYLTFPLRYYHLKHAMGDAHSFAQLTRFIPPDLYPLFERQGCRPMDQSAPQPSGIKGTLARPRRRW
jgi:DNA helicase-2/ATP-dependent DNA helicase PcrA